MSVFPGINEIDPGYEYEPISKDIPQERIYGPYKADPDKLRHNDINSLTIECYGSGKGLIRLVSIKDEETPIGLKALSIYSVLEEFASIPERVGRNRPIGTIHGENIERKTWVEKRFEEQDYKDNHQPIAVIVGGGQGGLTVAARLKSFGYNVLIVDSHERIGDNWRKRYKFLSLHDPFYYQLPYIHMDTSPIYSSKDQFANFLECYAKMLELNIWSNSTVDDASFDESNKIWDVKIINNSTLEIKRLYPKYLIFATGHSGEPNIPSFPNQNEFQGEIVHSSQHTSGTNYVDKKALVVGACNSAHDIAQDFYEQGAKDVTMLQRSSTCVISSQNGIKVIIRDVYDKNGPSIETADLIYHSNPLFLTNLLMQQQYRESSKLDLDLLEGLKSKGFKTNSGSGGCGLFSLYFRRGSGYYIDVGCSKLIIDEKIHLKRSSIKKFIPHGVELEDGSIIDDIDVIVLATGYSNMKETARNIFGDNVANKLNPVWGLDEEGELKTIFRNSGHENFYFMGGNLAIARFFSKRLALQIIAKEEGFN
ncbi:hypothetical protein WICMUC_004006 [Wickerhamomyces mucosus]|uniref:Flavin-containing monooxygenase n=1 Tax=Wickerhamomyces mucosus TaxID=1378264 RepID=A0A9P8TBL9_9ASCO|nr:hypothetical protein WICMUC_004006 [Wickerhamomyces mucosus]